MIVTPFQLGLPRRTQFFKALRQIIDREAKIRFDHNDFNVISEIEIKNCAVVYWAIRECGWPKDEVQTQIKLKSLAGSDGHFRSLLFDSESEATAQIDQAFAHLKNIGGLEKKINESSENTTENDTRLKDFIFQTIPERSSNLILLPADRISTVFVSVVCFALLLISLALLILLSINLAKTHTREYDAGVYNYLGQKTDSTKFRTIEVWVPSKKTPSSIIKNLIGVEVPDNPNKRKEAGWNVIAIMARDLNGNQWEELAAEFASVTEGNANMQSFDAPLSSAADELIKLTEKGGPEWLSLLRDDDARSAILEIAKEDLIQILSEGKLEDLKRVRHYYFDLLGDRKRRWDELLLNYEETGINGYSFTRTWGRGTGPIKEGYRYIISGDITLLTRTSILRMYKECFGRETGIFVETYEYR